MKKCKEHWHKWFAWYPVKIGKQRIWLKTIYRKLEAQEGLPWDEAVSYRWIYALRAWGID